LHDDFNLIAYDIHLIISCQVRPILVQHISSIIIDSCILDSCISSIYDVSRVIVLITSRANEVSVDQFYMFMELVKLD
jgi:hypothetical protein